MGFSSRTARVRAQLRRRDGDLCCWCHERMSFQRYYRDGRVPPDGATIEHIVPRSEGGSNDSGNLALAHMRCNRARKSRARPPLLASPAVPA